MAMLEDVPDLTLEFLNEATQAWVEFGYNRGIHSEIGQTPLARWAGGPGCAAAESRQRGAAPRLHAHRAAHPAAQRRHGGDRCAPLRSAERLPASDALLVRYARWDLSQVHLVDDTAARCCARLYPLDKTANANGMRRPLEPLGARRRRVSAHRRTGIAPLLAKLMAAAGRTGLPPPYLPTR